MPSKKRPSIKGKGADFFFEDKDTAKKEEAKKSPVSKQEKATFYLPGTLIDRLDDIWLDLRRTHKKVRKSDLARIAIEELLKDHESKQHDSKLSKHLNV